MAMSQEKDERGGPILPLCIPYVKSDERPAWQKGCTSPVVSGTLFSSKSPNGLERKATLHEAHL
jgi:hypothetical protein